MSQTLNRLASRWMLIAVAALVLTWPALVNGGAFYSTDSIAYIRAPDQAIVKLLGPGHATPWSAKPLGVGYREGGASASGAKSPPMAGRSIYYGLLANLGARAGGFWLTILVQAVAAALALDSLCAAVGWRRRHSFLLLALAAAFLTPLGFFVCCVMPDVWAPIAILGLAAMAAGGEQLSRGRWVICAALLVFAAMAHTSHLLLATTAIGVCAILAGLRRWTKLGAGAPGRAALVALAALVIGAASSAAFDMAVTKVYGAPPVHPPFLTARLVGGGRPGDAWLRRHCPAASLQACAYVPRLPMPTDVFLWSTDPDHSAFWTATPEQRATLDREQGRFVLAVTHDDPWGVARQLFIDGLTQAADMRMDEFNHKDSVRRSIEAWMVGPDAVVWRGSLAYRKAWPVQLLNAIEAGAVVLALAALAALVVQALLSPPSEARSRVLSAGLMIVVLVTANAFVCGGLSDIFGRYQARVAAPLILIGLIALRSLLTSPIGRGSAALTTLKSTP